MTISAVAKVRRRASVTSVKLRAGPTHRCNTNTVAYIVDRGCALPCSAKYIIIIIIMIVMIIIIVMKPTRMTTIILMMATTTMLSSS